MYALGEEQRRAGVAQVVPAYIRESGALEQGLEGALDDVLSGITTVWWTRFSYATATPYLTVSS